MSTGQRLFVRQQHAWAWSEMFCTQFKPDTNEVANGIFSHINMPWRYSLLFVRSEKVAKSKPHFPFCHSLVFSAGVRLCIISRASNQLGHTSGSCWNEKTWWNLLRWPLTSTFCWSGGLYRVKAGCFDKFLKKRVSSFITENRTRTQLRATGDSVQKQWLAFTCTYQEEHDGQQWDGHTLPHSKKCSINSVSVQSTASGLQYPCGMSYEASGQAPPFSPKTAVTATKNSKKKHTAFMMCWKYIARQVHLCCSKKAARAEVEEQRNGVKMYWVYWWVKKAKGARPILAFSVFMSLQSSGIVPGLQTKYLQKVKLRWWQIAVKLSSIIEAFRHRSVLLPRMDVHMEPYFSHPLLLRRLWKGREVVWSPHWMSLPLTWHPSPQMHPSHGFYPTPNWCVTLPLRQCMAAAKSLAFAFVAKFLVLLFCFGFQLYETLLFSFFFLSGFLSHPKYNRHMLQVQIDLNCVCLHLPVCVQWTTHRLSSSRV